MTIFAGNAAYAYGYSLDAQPQSSHYFNYFKDVPKNPGNNTANSPTAYLYFNTCITLPPGTTGTQLTRCLWGNGYIPPDMISVQGQRIRVTIPDLNSITGFYKDGASCDQYGYCSPVYLYPWPVDLTAIGTIEGYSLEQIGVTKTTMPQADGSVVTMTRNGQSVQTRNLSTTLRHVPA
ncbi:MAG: hypothetical protein IT165_13795 [Bryobacterales bacterium]|nr:hypothetical protein [Bryobacterales bacterium]